MRCRELFAPLFDYGLASLDDLSQFAVVVKLARKVEVSDGEIRLLSYRAAKFGDRLFKLPCLVERDAELVMRPGQIIVERERAPQLGDRFRQLPGLQKRGPQAVTRGGKVLFLRKRRAVRIDGSRQIALARVSEAEAVVSFRVRGFASID